MVFSIISKNNILVISECKYSNIGMSRLLKEHYGAYNIQLFYDFKQGGKSGKNHQARYCPELL